MALRFTAVAVTLSLLALLVILLTFSGNLSYSRGYNDFNMTHSYITYRDNATATAMVYCASSAHERERDTASSMNMLVDNAFLPTSQQTWVKCNAAETLAKNRQRLVKEYRDTHGAHVGVFFKHIHKAAGVYFCNAWAKQNTPASVRPKSVNCIPNEKHYCFVPTVGAWDGVGLASSEGPLPDIVPLLPPPRVVYVVVIRHPIDRTMSSYYYFLKLQKTKRKQRAKVDGLIPGECRHYYAPENASLAEFLHAYPDNYMTRDLCGESTWKLPKWAINDFHRECATRRLDSVFSVVLVTEREEMWEPLLRKELGWTSFPNGDGSAKHERGDGPTSAEEEVASMPNAAQIIETLEAMHVHDMRVYEHALRMHSK